MFSRNLTEIRAICLRFKRLFNNIDNFPPEDIRFVGSVYSFLKISFFFIVLELNSQATHINSEDQKDDIPTLNTLLKIFMELGHFPLVIMLTIKLNFFKRNKGMNQIKYVISLSLSQFIAQINCVNLAWSRESGAWNSIPSFEFTRKNDITKHVFTQFNLNACFQSVVNFQDKWDSVYFLAHKVY